MKYLYQWKHYAYIFYTSGQYSLCGYIDKYKVMKELLRTPNIGMWRAGKHCISIRALSNAYKYSKAFFDHGIWYFVVHLLNLPHQNKLYDLLR